MDFPGGAVNKNPSANAGDIGSISGPGRFHMPLNMHTQHAPHVYHNSSVHALKPVSCNYRSPYA